MIHLPLGRASRRCGRWLVLPALLSCVSTLWSPLAHGAPASVSDFDRRAARALYNSVRPGAVSAPESLKDSDVANMDLFEKDDAARTAKYALKFGKVDDAADPRGFYKISVGIALADLRKGNPPWTFVKTDATTGAELWSRPVNDSKNNDVEWGARRKIGPLTLTVDQRLAGATDKEKAAAFVLSKFQRLLANAQENQLMGRISLSLVLADGERPVDPAQFFPIDVSSSAQPIRVPMRIKLVDAQDREIAGMAKQFSMTPKGPLAEYMTIEGKGIEKRLGKAGQARYTISDADIANFEMVMAPTKGTGFERDLLKQLETGGEPGSQGVDPSLISLSLGVKYR